MVSDMLQNCHVSYIYSPVCGRYIHSTLKMGAKINECQSGKLNETKKDYMETKIVITIKILIGHSK